MKIIVRGFWYIIKYPYQLRPRKFFSTFSFQTLYAIKPQQEKIFQPKMANST